MGKKKVKFCTCLEKDKRKITIYHSTAAMHDYIYGPESGRDLGAVSRLVSKSVKSQCTNASGAGR
jgi:hypothetical protein